MQLIYDLDHDLSEVRIHFKAHQDNEKSNG